MGFSLKQSPLLPAPLGVIDDVVAITGVFEEVGAVANTDVTGAVAVTVLVSLDTPATVNIVVPTEVAGRELETRRAPLTAVFTSM